MALSWNTTADRRDGPQTSFAKTIAFVVRTAGRGQSVPSPRPKTGESKQGRRSNPTDIDRTRDLHLIDDS